MLGGVVAGVGLGCSVVVLVLLFRAWASGVNKGPAIRASVPKSSIPMGSHLMEVVVINGVSVMAVVRCGG